MRLFGMGIGNLVYFGFRISAATMTRMTGDAYLDPYRDSARRHGAGFRVTLWANETSQQRRFEVFHEMLDLRGKRILDAGCSRGDLAQYLLEHQAGFDRYVGIDALPNVIDFAVGRKLPGCEFHCGDFVSRPRLLATGDAHVIAISGTLNTMSDSQINTLLEAAWRHARETLIFNFLSDRCGPEAPPQDGFARRLDPLRLIAWATARTWSVIFRQDYFPAGHDATILMRKM